MLKKRFTTKCQWEMRYMKNMQLATQTFMLSVTLILSRFVPFCPVLSRFVPFFFGCGADEEFSPNETGPLVLDPTNLEDREQILTEAVDRLDLQARDPASVGAVLRRTRPNAICILTVSGIYQNFLFSYHDGGG